VGPIREILFLGSWARLPHCPYTTPRVVPIGAVSTTLLRSLRWSVLVLGDEALRTLQPHFVTRNAPFPACLVLAATDAGPLEVSRLWTQSRAVEIVTTDTLAVRLAAAVHAPLRLRVPKQEWMPRTLKPESPCERAATVLTELPCLTIESWAAALGQDRHTLQRQCADELGCTPTDLRWAYVLGVTRRERADGWTVVQVARSLGLDDDKSLWRLFRVRRHPMPRRGPESQHPLQEQLLQDATL
jgi:AraC-like DNA-binding protein